MTLKGTFARTFSKPIKVSMEPVHHSSEENLDGLGEIFDSTAKKKRQPREKKTTAARDTPAHTGRGRWLREKQDGVGACCFSLRKIFLGNTYKKWEKPDQQSLAWQSAAVVALFRCFIPRELLILQDLFSTKGVSLMSSFSWFLGIRVRRWGLYVVEWRLVVRVCCVFPRVVRPTAKWRARVRAEN